MKICPRCLKQFQDDALVECPDDGTALKSFLDQTTQLIGRVLDDRWAIEEKIGEGGMGEVYRARQINVDRVVAVKVLRLALASTEEYVARFFREADIATSVQHPHFVSIYDFGQTSGDQLLYIAMELLEGTSLAAQTRKRRLPLIDVLTIASQVCAALAAAHDAQIVHRDLKPDNIFLVDVPEGGPFVKVLDFGIAKNLDNTSKVTRTGQLFGTPEYMSPEQCEGSDRVDGRSDLYSVGCILYELLTGRSPFKRDSIIQTLIAQVSEDVPTFDELELPVPAQVQAIVQKLMEKHPDNRFPNAIKAREALQEEIDRLKGHSIELRAYDTVSAKLSLRRRGAETVSYSDLGHPLQLEGVLADSARYAISREADKRRSAESEMATDKVQPQESTNNRLFLLALLPVVAVSVWYLSRPATPPIDLGAALTQARASSTEAWTSAGVSAHRAVAESDGRRRANGIALAAVTVAVSEEEAPPAAKASGKPSRPAELLGVRTQTSMSQQLLSKQRDLLRCYNRREDQNDGGSVVFHFEVEPSGDASVRVASKTLASKTVLTCMKSVADRVTFAAAATSATFEKTLKFSAVEQP